jgi:hypothetical protein
MECEFCKSVSAETAGDLVTIGGSHDPFSDPGGELRKCPRCASYFIYTRDHDNEIGYQAMDPTLDRIDSERARAFAAEAISVAIRQRDYFAKKEDSYSRDVAGQYAAEIKRLQSEFPPRR